MSNSNKYQALLFDISQIITYIKPFQEALDAILMKTAEKLKMSLGMISIADEKNKEAVVRVAYGLTDMWMDSGRYKFGEGITGRVVETGEPMFIENMAQEPRFMNKAGKRKDEDKTEVSFICVPIRNQTEIIGTIAFDKKYRNLKEANEDLKAITIISSMITQIVRLYRSENEEKEMLKKENSRLQNELKERFNPLNLVTASKSMKDAYVLAEKAAVNDFPVLIIGESGAGKERLAKVIHYESRRASGPFIKYNCLSLHGEMADAELFGQSKTAGEGGSPGKTGLLEKADKGTLMLGEIGGLSPYAQAMILRVINEGEFEKAGKQTVKADVRIIATTSWKFDDEIYNDLFRRDLYYRLSVFPIPVAALRERKADIPMLADFFAKKYAEICGKKINRIARDALDLMTSYHWPGNVTELDNCIERAVMTSYDGVIHAYHLPSTMQQAYLAGEGIK